MVISGYYRQHFLQARGLKDGPKRGMRLVRELIMCRECELVKPWRLSLDNLRVAVKERIASRVSRQGAVGVGAGPPEQGDTAPVRSIPRKKQERSLAVGEGPQRLHFDEADRVSSHSHDAPQSSRRRSNNSHPVRETQQLYSGTWRQRACYTQLGPHFEAVFITRYEAQNVVSIVRQVPAPCIQPRLEGAGRCAAWTGKT